jgi:isoquinoline 1-oxidoreductase beta subunit
MSGLPEVSRRTFLFTGAAAGGGLGLAIGSGTGLGGRPAQAHEGEDHGEQVRLSARITLGTDGIVTVIVPRAEMGQGVYTSLPMLAADELDVDFANVRVEHAPVGSEYTNYALIIPEVYADDPPGKNGFLQFAVRNFMGWQMTGGSSSVRDAWTTMRVAGAAARHMLTAEAAERFGVEPEDCTTELGFVVHGPSGQRLAYGDLAAGAATRSPPADPAYRDPAKYRYIGKPVPRLDIPAKVDGTAIFGIDVRLPEMLIATVRNVPIFGGAVASFNAAAVRDLPGMEGVMEVPGGIAVAADSYWHAKTALDALPVEWHPGPDAATTSDALFARFATALDADDESKIQDEGDAEDELASAGRIVAAEYRVPHLAHATMEPQTCTALVTSERCEIWVGTQVPDFVQAVAEDITGLSGDEITLHTTYLGGGFGRRLETDVVAQALTLAKAIPGRPVKVVWSREEDMQHDMYRPAVLSRFRASLDTNGLPHALEHRFATQSMFKQFARRNLGWLLRTAMGSTADKMEIGAAVTWPYRTANIKVAWTAQEASVPVGNWRSVSHSYGAFFNEVFIDELAAAAGRDPIDYRLALLEAKPRHRAVLEMLAEKSAWGRIQPKGRGMGVAIHESFESIVGEVAEVSVSDGGELRVERVTCVVDCGEAINPDTIRAQMESAIVYGLTAALYGEITVTGGRVDQNNFPDYEMVRLATMPQIATHILLSHANIGGIGEPGTPPIAPAVINAIFAATGRRVRTLPLMNQGFAV